jgi:hypothetical protein
MSSFAAVVVDEVLEELQGRSGFDAWAEEIDPHIWEALVDRLVERVEEVSRGSIVLTPGTASGFLRVTEILHDCLGPGAGDVWDDIDENDKSAYDGYWDVITQVREVAA